MNGEEREQRRVSSVRTNETRTTPCVYDSGRKVTMVTAAALATRFPQCAEASRSFTSIQTAYVRLREVTIICSQAVCDDSVVHAAARHIWGTNLLGGHGSDLGASGPAYSFAIPATSLIGERRHQDRITLPPSRATLWYLSDHSPRTNRITFFTSRATQWCLSHLQGQNIDA